MPGRSSPSANNRRYKSTPPFPNPVSSRRASTRSLPFPPVSLPGQREPYRSTRTRAEVGPDIYNIYPSTRHTALSYCRGRSHNGRTCNQPSVVTAVVDLVRYIVDGPVRLFFQHPVCAQSGNHQASVAVIDPIVDQTGKSYHAGNTSSGQSYPASRSASIFSGPGRRFRKPSIRHSGHVRCDYTCRAANY